MAFTELSLDQLIRRLMDSGIGDGTSAGTSADGGIVVLTRDEADQIIQKLGKLIGRETGLPAKLPRTESA